jgi:hypothetical protein
MLMLIALLEINFFFWDYLLSWRDETSAAIIKLKVEIIELIKSVIQGLNKLRYKGSFIVSPL